MSNPLVDYVVECALAAECYPWKVEPEVKEGFVRDTKKYMPHKELAQIIEFPDMFGHNTLLLYEGGEFSASMLGSETALRSFMSKNSASLVIPGLQKLSSVFGEVCDAVAKNSKLEAFATGFQTPAGKPGLDVHWDKGTVVAIQLEGTKHWRLWPPVVDTVEALRTLRPITPEERARPPFMELQLRAGDVLFVPRGWLHTAACGEESSFHVSLGIVHTDMQHLKLRGMS